MTTTETTVTDNINWGPAQLRVTIFPTISPLTLPIAEMWNAAQGEPADKIENDTKQGLITLTSSSGQLSSTVTASADRIHFNYTHMWTPTDIIEHTLPVQDSLDETIETVRTDVANWLEQEAFPPFYRIAFGGVFLSQVATKKAGYLALQKYLPAVVIDPESFDFNFQINRRRKPKSTQSIDYINRMSTWNVVKIDAGVSTMSGEQRIATETTFACRTALDINTPANHDKELQSNTINELLDELISLGKEILEQGAIE